MTVSDDWPCTNCAAPVNSFMRTCPSCQQPVEQRSAPRVAAPAPMRPADTMPMRPADAMPSPSSPAEPAVAAAPRRGVMVVALAVAALVGAGITALVMGGDDGDAAATSTAVSTTVETVFETTVPELTTSVSPSAVPGVVISASSVPIAIDSVPPLLVEPPAPSPDGTCPSLVTDYQFPLVICGYGDAILVVQLALNDAVGAGLTTDGQFGHGTQTAVVAYQQQQGLSQTGMVDFRTWALLFPQDSPAPGNDVNGDGNIEPSEVALGD